jgi:sulfate adenylyltransferase large subunit
MATGASTADAAVVLIDASKGVLIQSRRHAYIASLLRVGHVLVAVNKMDLIGYDEDRFRAIEQDFKLVLEQIAADTGNPVESIFVPVSALKGDNIVHRSDAMPWYEGPSLLELLESAPTSLDTRADGFRFPVQRVLRPDHTFRGFSGQIASGTVRTGDKITVLPSGRSAEVARIVTWDGDLAEAPAPLSVTLVLNRELDISRGDLIVSTQTPATVAKSVSAALVWMDQRPLERNRRYLLKHTSQTVPAYIASIEHRTDIGTLTHEPAETLKMNDIGVATLTLLRPIAVDLYGENRSTGAFILIDPETNATVAAGMITAASGQVASGATASGPVTAEERAARWGHHGGVLELNGPVELVDRIERSLFVRGAVTVRIEIDDAAFGLHADMVQTLIRSKVLSGMVALIVTLTGGDTLTAQVEDEQISLDANDSSKAIAAVYELLGRTGILVSPDSADWQI